MRHEIDAEIVEGDDMRLVQQERAADPRRAALASRLQTDEVGEFTRAGPPLLDHGDAVGGCDRSRIDGVDALRTEPAQKRRQ